MSEYTPSEETLTWEDIRRRWAASEFADSAGPGDWAYEHADFGPLDRWLASERARIWDECDAAIVAHVERNGTSAEGWPSNPYRKDGDSE